MGIVIVGMSPHDQLPSGEKWGLPWDEGKWVHYDRLFEMHDLSLIENHPEARPLGYVERLKDIQVPIYMQEAYFPNVTRYPIEDTNKYINSSIAYMVALAISEDVDKISLFGVDMSADEEYSYQRPNIEYLLGVAEGKGIEVFIPKRSPLLKFSGSINYGNHIQDYKERYGCL